MSSVVPDGWELSPLSSLADYKNGRAFKPSDWSKSGLPILRIAQINNPHKVEDYYDGNDIDDGHFITKGDLIFSWSATLKAEIWSHYDAVLNQHIFKVTEKVGTNRSYLQQLLDYAIPKLAESSHGSTMKHIKKGVLDEFFSPVPPLPEQKKIASILTSVDEVIENTQKQIDKLQDLKKATMNELLTKGIGHTEFKDSELGRIPEGWYSKRLGDVASIIMGQSPTSDTYNENENGTPFFQGKADFGVKHPKVRYWCTSPTKIAPVDSILFSVRAPVGAVNLNNVKACIGRGVASISGKSIDNTFLYQSLIHAKVKFEALGQGSTFEAINGNELKEFSLACPPLQEQKKIASILTSMDKNIEEKQRKLAQTQSLKKSLMQDLLTGKVRVMVN